MSWSGPKKTPVAVLRTRLKLLGLLEEPAGKNLLDSIKGTGVPGHAVEAVNHLLARLVEKQKLEFKASLQAVIDKL